MTQNTDRDSLALARQTWRILEPYHGAVYFSPESTGQYAELGVDARTGYFASRSAAARARCTAGRTSSRGANTISESPPAQRAPSECSRSANCG